MSEGPRDNIVPHPRAAQWAERDRALRADDARKRGVERDAARRELLDQQRLALHGASHSRLSQQDRLALARNLGRMALDICRSDKRAAIRLSAAALEPHRHLRARWVRFAHEGIEKASPEEIDAQTKGAVGATYLEIAQGFCVASLDGGRQAVTPEEATLRLLRGTSFDPHPEVLQVATDQEAQMSQCLADLRSEILKLSPQLPSYFELVATHELQHPYVDTYETMYQPFGRDRSRLATVASTRDHGGAGHLVPGAINDGSWMTEGVPRHGKPDAVDQNRPAQPADRSAGGGSHRRRSGRTP